MIKVLWICNIMLPAIAKALSLPYSNREGWLSGCFDALTKEEGNLQLSVCYPIEKGKKEPSSPVTVRGVKCYGFPEDLAAPEIYDKEMETAFAKILEEVKPDILHIFGTEFPHTLAAVRAFGKPEKTLLGIQGLCYRIAGDYMAGLPKEIQRQVTFRDFVRRDSLKRQQEKFYLRGKNEIESISLTGHITGRTAFDREGTARINEKAVYHPMNETMRSSFYEGEWKRETCQEHSIFLGQGDYPLKGFHFLLEAMPKILESYPDAVLYVAGNSTISNSTLKEKLKLPAYGKYLLSLIQKYALQDKVISLGRLTEEEMKQQYLRSHVFVCASVLENSPNTVGEAMLLGVPVVASRTGGIPDMLTDGREGILFETGNADALASAIKAVFDDSRDKEGMTLAKKLSLAERKRAKNNHDREANYQRLLAIYSEISGV